MFVEILIGYFQLNFHNTDNFLDFPFNFLKGISIYDRRDEMAFL